MVHPDALHRKITAIKDSVRTQLAIAVAKKAGQNSVSSQATVAPGAETKSSAGPLMLVKVDPSGKPILVQMEPDAAEASEKAVKGGAPDQPVQRPFTSEREFAKTLLGNRPIRYMLNYAIANISSVNTAQTFAVAADPVSSADISGVFAALFDEMRTVEAKCEYTMVMNASGGTAASSPQTLWGGCWDPSDSAGEASLVAILAHTEHVGPLPAAVSFGVSAGTGQSICTVVPVTRNGMYTQKSGPIRQTLAGDSSGTVQKAPIGSNWVPTTSSSATAGWFKWYIPSLGANATSYLTGYITLTVEFRFQT